MKTISATDKPKFNKKGILLTIWSNKPFKAYNPESAMLNATLRSLRGQGYKVETCWLGDATGICLSK